MNGTVVVVIGVVVVGWVLSSVVVKTPEVLENYLLLNLFKKNLF